MSFVFTGELNEANQIAMRGVIDAAWFKLENEHPDQDFMDFIMVMIGNHNSMENISGQLEEVGIEKDKASTLVGVMAAKLKEIQSQAGPSKEQPQDTTSVAAKSKETTIGSVHGGANSKVMTGALGTDRAGKTTGGSGGGRGKATGGASSSSLSSSSSSSLDGGLSAGRYPSKQITTTTTTTSNNNSSGNKRSNDNKNNFKNHSNNSNQQQQKRFKNDTNSNNSSTTTGGSPAVGSVEYFQQMNNIAVASGFKNAHEMIASQKEMMQMMAPPAPFQPPQPTAPMPSAPPTPSGAPPPHYPTAGGGVHHGYLGRGHAQYRGRGQPGRGEYRGRGGYAGRGRASFPPPPGGQPPAPAVADGGSTEVDAAAVAAATATAGVVDGADTTYVPAGAYRGRGAWRGAPTGGRFQVATAGRGYQGRNYNPNFGGRGAGKGEGGGVGAPAAFGSNTWVREPDMDSSLSSGR